MDHHRFHLIGLLIVARIGIGEAPKSFAVGRLVMGWR